MKILLPCPGKIGLNIMEITIWGQIVSSYFQNFFPEQTCCDRIIMRGGFGPDPRGFAVITSRL